MVKKNSPQKIIPSLDLNDIQANILKPHGRAIACCVFLVLEKKPTELKEWLSAFPKKYDLTTANDQVEDSCKRKKEKENGVGYNFLSQGKTVLTLHLTASGFEKMGFEDPTKSKQGNDQLPQDTSFWNAGKQLEDRKIYSIDRSIESDRRSSTHFDAMLIIADNSKKLIYNKILKINNDLLPRGLGCIKFFEMGEKIKIGGKTRENFGYQDGINNVPLLKNNKPQIATCRDVVFDNNNGSYLVFLKIEQNIKAFNAKVRRLAEELCINEAYAGAQIFGRSKDGIPISLMDDKNNIMELNSSPSISKCPYHAHIRKANYHSKKEDKIQIVRRGITYKNKIVNVETNRIEEEVGLLFMSFQKSIKDQFEKIQERFGDPDFPFKNTGVDVIMGKNNKNFTNDQKTQKWKRLNDLEDKEIDFHSLISKNDEPLGEVVKLRYGGYFYTPTISFLNNLPKMK